ncbi:MAG: hypothetical protein OXU72_19155 [Gammaproteobacteria bacterium]|nr:hypothetical protein [Gammaproteobacteria bacterium]
MRREVRRKAEAKANRQAIMWPAGVGIVLLIGVVTLYQIGTDAPETDDRLCPRDTGPVGTTVLLLDTSDPLTDKHKAELERLAGQIAAEDAGRMGIAAGELLAVYELSQDPGASKLLIEVCRPFKNPKHRTWRDDIHQGSRIAKREWDRFEDALSEVFPEREGESQPTSPLLETIAVLAARHIPGKRGDERFNVHLVVFSDLLQHSSRLSQYGPYPDATEMRRNARDLLTDLSGTRVSLFRLERPKYAKWQTERHYYWWTELILEQGGRIEWQDSI